jgi:hypothetical protein
MSRASWYARQLDTYRLEREIERRLSWITGHRRIIAITKRELNERGMLSRQYDNPVFCEDEDLLSTTLSKHPYTGDDPEWSLLSALLQLAICKRLVRSYGGELRRRKGKKAFVAPANINFSDERIAAFKKSVKLIQGKKEPQKAVGREGEKA